MTAANEAKEPEEPAVGPETELERQVRWLYLHERAVAVHALLDSSVRTALCGLAPAWWHPDREWRGRRSEAEQWRAEQLPRCKRCARAVAARRDERLTEAQRFPPPKTRPQMTPEGAEFFNWLKDNGIDEWLPDQPVVLVKGGRLRYTAWRWAGPRGWDSEQVRAPIDDDDPMTEWRELPLLAEVTDRIREVCRSLPVHLVEVPPG